MSESVNTPTLPAAAPDGDAAVIAAFRRWLDRCNDIEMIPGHHEKLRAAAFKCYQQAISEVMAAPTAGAIGLALKAYLVLSVEVCAEFDWNNKHYAGISLPGDNEGSWLDGKDIHSFFEAVCRIVPDLRQLADLQPGEAASLHLAGEAAP